MKVPKPRKLASGSYFIQLRIDGESISITKPTALECTKAAELEKARLRNGMKKRRTATRLTLRDAVDNYIDARGTALSPSTIRGYKCIRNTRFQKAMDLPLSASIKWQSIVNAEAQKCSARTVSNAWHFIASVLRENDMDVPKIKLPQAVPNERQWLDPDQIRVFINAAKGDLCELAMLLCLHSCRKSEVFALTKADFDFTDADGTIRIHSAKVLDETGRYVTKSTGKTVAATRTIPVMIPRVRELVEMLPEDDSSVAPYWPNMLYKHINAICEKNDLPLVGVHGLRHSFASLAYHLGWSEAYTMKIGGWEDIATMRKVYTHIAEKDKLKASNSMADFYKSLTKNANEV